MKIPWKIVFYGCLFFVQVAWMQEKKDSAEVLAKADQLFTQRQYQEACEVYKIALQESEYEGHLSIQVEALSQIARCYLIQEQPQVGETWLQKAKQLAKPEEAKGWARYLGVFGRFQWKSKKLEEATLTFKTMYQFCLDHELHNEAIDAAHMVGITGNPAEQNEWALKGIQAAEKGKLEGWLGPLWNNLGWSYEEQGKLNEALEALQKAREYHWKLGNEHSKLVADWSVGAIYRRQKEYEKALAWLRPVLAWAQRRYAEKNEPERAEWIGMTLQELAEIAIAQNQWENAQRDFKQAEEYLRIAQMPSWDASGFEKLMKRQEEVQQHLLKKE